MNQIFLITKREFLTQVKKKSFILITLLAPLLLVGFGGLIALMLKANETTTSVNVIDRSGLFAPHLESTKTIKYVVVGESSEQQILKVLKESETAQALLVIPSLKGKDYPGLQKETKLYVNQKIGLEHQSTIASDLSKVVREEKIKDLGLKASQIEQLEEPFTLVPQNIKDDKVEDSGLNFGVKYGLSMVLMYVIFMFIIIYGVRVMRSVLEEKNNRVVEIIISSVKPFSLMMGKILGVTLVALTQFAVWITMSIGAALVLNTSVFPAAGAVGSMPGAENLESDAGNLQQMAGEISTTLLSLNVPLIVVSFILFFLLGYIFYSAIYAAIGSAVDNETETQQFTLFAILPLTLGMYGSITIINNPEGPLALWLSMIPFTSPVAMIARIPFGVPLWQIAASLLLLLLSAAAMVYVAGKIYRVGILMHGNKASLKELWKWLRA